MLNFPFWHKRNWHYNLRSSPPYTHPSIQNHTCAQIIIICQLHLWEEGTTNRKDYSSRNWPQLMPLSLLALMTVLHQIISIPSQKTREIQRIHSYRSLMASERTRFCITNVFPGASMFPVSVKSQTVKSFIFIDHIYSVTVIQFYHSRIKIVMYNTIFINKTRQRTSVAQ